MKHIDAYPHCRADNGEITTVVPNQPNLPKLKTARKKHDLVY